MSTLPKFKVTEVDNERAGHDPCDDCKKKLKVGKYVCGQVFYIGDQFFLLHREDCENT